MLYFALRDSDIEMYFKHIYAAGHVPEYAYYTTAANLDTLLICKKIFSPQISVNVQDMYMHPLQLYMLRWTSSMQPIPLTIVRAL